MVPPHDWITYNEPEGHLDELVDTLMALPGVGPGAVAGGVSFKDDSTLARLERKGLQTWRLDLHEDLGVSDRRSGWNVEVDNDSPMARTIASRSFSGSKPKTDSLKPPLPCCAAWQAAIAQPDLFRIGRIACVKPTCG